MPLHCLPLHTNHIEHGIGLRTCFFHSLQTFKAALRNEDNAKQQRSHWMARDPVPNQHRGVELIDAPRLWQVDIIRRSILPHSCLLNEIWEQREAPCVPISTHHVVHEDFGTHTMGQLFHWMGPDPVPNPHQGVKLVGLADACVAD